MIAVGRKGRDFFSKRPVKILSEHVNMFGRLEFSHALPIAKQIIDLYTEQKVDAVDFLYNEFKSIMTQRVIVERYLPIKPVAPAQGEALIDYLYEQPAEGYFRCPAAALCGNRSLPGAAGIPGGRAGGPDDGHGRGHEQRCGDD